ASKQTLFDAASITNASPGKHSLKVIVPNSYFQIDFVCGLPIDPFGPAGSNIFYSAQGRIFGGDNEGTQVYAASSLSGIVYVEDDDDADEVWEPGDPGIAGVTLNLRGTDIHGNAVSALATTDSTG